MRPPVRTTLVFGLLSALAIMPMTFFLASAINWFLAFKLALWTDLCLYALLLARWGGRSPGAVLFPLALLMAAAWWPGTDTLFFFLGVGVLSWVRSGICFFGKPLRSVLAEMISSAGGAGLVALLNPASAVAWTIGIWLFYLMQALYFYVVPVVDRSTVTMESDPFERAHREARHLLEH